MAMDGERCLQQGKRWKKRTSKVTAVQDPWAPVEENLAAILKAVIQKRRSQPVVIRTAVVDEADFQSIAFLQGGSQKANAVCRIVQEFSLDEFRNLIRTIKDSDTFDFEVFDSVPKINDVFSIPAEIAEGILTISENSATKLFQESQFLSPPRLVLACSILKYSLTSVNKDKTNNGKTIWEWNSEKNHLELNKTDIAASDLYTILGKVTDNSRAALLQELNQEKKRLEKISAAKSEAFQKEIEAFTSALDDTSPGGEKRKSALNQLAIAFYKEVFLGALMQINDSMLAKINPIPLGTGFLVGENHLLTNNHVIQSAAVAEQCIAQFNYVEDEAGVTQQSEDYRFDPGALFVTNPDLDYTLVQLKTNPFRRQAGYEFGWIQMVENEVNAVPGLVWLREKPKSPDGSSKTSLSTSEIQEQIQKRIRLLTSLNALLRENGYVIEPGQKLDDRSIIVIRHPRGRENRDIQYLQQLDPKAQRFKELLKDCDYEAQQESGEPVYLVQHPQGRQKQVVLADNKVINDGLFKDFLRYRADSDYGSSGCPVFNSRWQLVALHHAAIWEGDDFSGKITAQQGIRIHTIIRDLKRKRFGNPQLQHFIESYVVTAEQLNYPPLPCGLEFDGVSAYIDAVVSAENKELTSISIFSADVGGTIRGWTADGLPVRALETFRMGSSPFQLFGFLPQFGNFPGFQVPVWHGGGRLFWIAGDRSQLYISGEEAKPIDLDAQVVHAEVIVEGAFLAIATADPSRPDRPSSRLVFRQIPDNLLQQFVPNADGPGPSLPNTVRQERSQMYTELRKIEQTFDSNITAIYSFQTSDRPELTFYAGLWIAVAFENGAIEVFRFSYMAEGGIRFGRQETVVKHNAAIQSVSFDMFFLLDSASSSSSQYFLFASASQDGIIKVSMIRAESRWVWESIPGLEARHDSVSWIQLLPNFYRGGYYPGNAPALMTAGRDGSIFLWEIDWANRKWKSASTQLQGHPAAINRLVFSPASLNVISASVDGVVKVWEWNLTKLTPINSLTLNSSLVDLQFNPANLSLTTSPNPPTPTPTPDNAPSFTLEAWVNPHPDGTGGTIISQFDPANLNGSFFILSVTKDGRVAYKVFLTLQQEYQTKSLLPFGQFSHVAVVCDSTKKELAIYINGQKEETDQPVALTPANTPGAISPQAAKPAQKMPLLMGGYQGKLQATASGGSNTGNTASQTGRDIGPLGLFKGVIAEVRAWNRARTQAEIQQTIFSRLNEQESGLVGYWRFEEGTFTDGKENRVYNLASRDRTFGLISGARRVRVYSPPLPLPFAVEFDGNDQYIECQGFTIPESPAGLTVAAWVKHQFGNGYIVHHLSPTKSAVSGKPEKNGYALQWYEYKLRVILAKSQEIIIFDTYDRLPNDGAWHHVAFSWSATTQEVELYLDGVRQNIIAVQGEAKSILMGGLYKSVGHFPEPLQNSGKALTIGGTGSKVKADYFDGAIAEVQIWGISRTQNEIRSTLFNRIEQPEQQNDLLGYWRLDETIKVDNKIRIRDRSQSQKHGDVFGATWFPVAVNQPIDLVQDPAAELIQQVLDRNLLPGFWSAGALKNDPRFLPSENITLAQYNEVLSQTFDLDRSSDLPANKVGVNQTGNSISREAAIAHLVDILGLTIQAPPEEILAKNPELKPYQEDYKNVDPLYKPQILSALLQRMIVIPAEAKSGSSSNSKLRPGDPMTRGEFAALLARSLVASGQAPESKVLPSSVISAGIKPPVDPKPPDPKPPDPKPPDPKPPVDPKTVIPADYWATPFLQKLAQHDMSFKQELEGGTLIPHNPVSWDEYAALAGRVLGVTLPARSNQTLTRLTAVSTLTQALRLTGRIPEILSVYRDCDQIQTYCGQAQIPADAIASATAHGLVLAYPWSDQFRPADKLTRAELATLIYQGLVFQGKAERVNSPFIAKPAPITFTDLDQHWAKDRILDLASRGVVRGFPDRSFKPDQLINRAEFAAILVKAFNPIPTRPRIDFSDVPSDFWARQAIEQVYRSQLMNGISSSSNQFAPNAAVTRLQAIIVLVYCLKQNKSLPTPDCSVLAFFTDISNLPTGFQNGIAIAVQLGFDPKPTEPTQFLPNTPVSRAVVAVWALHALKQLEE